MGKFNLSDLAKYLGGSLEKERNSLWFSGIEIDSRRIKSGDLFFALKGRMTDGHRFVNKAFKNGAIAAVVSKDGSYCGPVLIVDDTYKALVESGGWIRRFFKGEVIAITGSCGKTTTKELLVKMLSQVYRVTSTAGNYNSVYGIPISLSVIDLDADFFVAETAMSEKGELATISNMLKPDYALVLNVEAVHVGNLGSIEKVAEAKREIVEGLQGILFYYRDNRWSSCIGDKWKGKKVSFGRSIDSDYRLLETKWIDNGWYCVINTPRGKFECKIPHFGYYQIYNFLAASTVAIEIGLELKYIDGSLLVVPKHRGEFIKLRTGAVIDDSYNSNPKALEEVLKSIDRLPYRKKIFILGEMKELGKFSKSFHIKAGRLVATLKPELVIGVGGDARYMIEEASKNGINARFVETVDEIDYNSITIDADSLIVVKGSRSVTLDKAVKCIIERFGR